MPEVAHTDAVASTDDAVARPTCRGCTNTPLGWDESGRAVCRDCIVILDTYVVQPNELHLPPINHRRERLVALADLEAGWEEGYGDRIGRLALSAAAFFLCALSERDQKKYGVYPASDGGVLVEWPDVSREPGTIISVEFNPDGTADASVMVCLYPPQGALRVASPAKSFYADRAVLDAVSAEQAAALVTWCTDSLARLRQEANASR